jgi:hypothetical protein
MTHFSSALVVTRTINCIEHVDLRHLIFISAAYDHMFTLFDILLFNKQVVVHIDQFLDHLQLDFVFLHVYGITENFKDIHVNDFPVL